MRPSTLAEISSRVQLGEPLDKAVAEFLDMFYGAPDAATAHRMLEDEPAPTGVTVTDAMLAAIADYLAIQFTRAEPPSWARSPDRILREPYFTTISNDPAMHEWLVHHSPAEFKQHNIFTEDQPLRRKKSAQVPWAPVWRAQ